VSADDKHWLLRDVAQMHRLAALLAGYMQRGDALLLEGTLGAGKTEFARGFIHAAGAPGEHVTSPTFTLAQPYDIRLAGAPATCWHVDLYRIEESSELAELGLESMAEEGILLIEWPERLGASVTMDTITVKILLAPEGTHRMVSLQFAGRFPALASEIDNECDRQFSLYEPGTRHG
jgi:tRNA threonylcarbamoyladenosine biosynthesis protein TsaE